MIKSSANRPPRVGDVWLWKGLPGEQYTTTSLPTDGVTMRCVCPDGFKGTMWMSCWNDGDYTIISEGPLPNAAPDAPVACEKWCGNVDPLGAIIDGTSVIRPFRIGDGRAYCTQACADRAAKPASGEGACGRVIGGMAGNSMCNRPSGHFDECEWSLEKERARARVATPTAAKPQPAPWKCPGVAVGGTIRACPRPDLPQWKPGHMRCAVCQDGHVAACMAQKEAGRVRPVMRFDSVPQPRAPRTRDVYRTDNWRDPDWLPNRETP